MSSKQEESSISNISTLLLSNGHVLVDNHWHGDVHYDVWVGCEGQGCSMVKTPPASANGHFCWNETG